MIQVVDHWQDRSWDLDDDEGLWAWTQEHLPSVMLQHPRTADDLLRAINGRQNYSALRRGAPEVDVPPAVAAVFRAAGLLRTGLDLHHPDHRVAAVAWEGDAAGAALAACGLEPTEAARAALAGLLSAEPRDVAKAELEEPVEPLTGPVLPGCRDAEATADAVGRALERGQVRPAHVDGKHSKGSWLVQTEDGPTLFLKPGSGPQSPAAGAREQPAGQAQREAAYWACMQVVGLGAWAPRADLLSIDGRDYAAQVWLGKGWDKIQDVFAADPQRVLEALRPYLQDGTLHRLAGLAWVLGDTDGHGDNVLYRPGEPLQLIDHGSALAGDGFDPAHDPRSFVPWYLRVWATHKSEVWQGWAPADRFARMPVLQEGPAQRLGGWLLALGARDLAETLQRFGAAWEPIVRRLLRVQQQIGSGTRADAVVNLAWTMGLDG